MTPDERAASRAICEKATATEKWDAMSGEGMYMIAERDVAFCKHARTALPAALDELDAKDETIQALTDKACHYGNLCIELGATPEQLQDEYAVKLYHQHEAQGEELRRLRKQQDSNGIIRQTWTKVV